MKIIVTQLNNYVNPYKKNKVCMKIPKHIYGPKGKYLTFLSEMTIDKTNGKEAKTAIARAFHIFIPRKSDDAIKSLISPPPKLSGTIKTEAIRNMLIDITPAIILTTPGLREYILNIIPVIHI